MICIAPVVRRTAISAVLAALALVASAACSSGGAEKGGAGANPTVATDPPTTTTTNPYAVPAVIDVAYVNRVIAGLDAAMGDVTRLVVRTRTIPREAYDRLRAIYDTDEWLQLAIDGFQLDMRRQFAGYRENPGNKVSTVTEMITSSPTCVFVRTVRDYSPIGANSKTEDIQWVAIKPLQQARDPNRYNVTGWAFAYEGFSPNRSVPTNPCVG